MTNVPGHRRVAAIDCGTNAIRLLIADVAPGGDALALVDVHRQQRVVRLGEGVDQTGRLTTAAIDRTWQVLAEYVAAIRAAGATAVRMAATSAVRDATNADEFVAMVRTTLGHDPDILSGTQEAELGFRGTVSNLRSAQRVMVVDIGGGSTELVLGTVRGEPGAVAVPDWSCSIDIGAVRLTERYLRSDPPQVDEIAQATEFVAEEVGRALADIDCAATDSLIGVGGTVLTIAAGALRHRRLDESLLHLQHIPFSDVHKVTTTLLDMNSAARALTGYVVPGRADVIGAGALIASVIGRQVEQRTGIAAMTVSVHDLLDGLALSLLDGPTDG